MKPYDTNNLREILQDKESFTRLARYFVIKLVEQAHEEAETDEENLFYDMLEKSLELLVDEGIELIFNITESPIERIFINSLMLNFIKADPLNLIIIPSLPNAPKQIIEFREYHLKFKDFIAWYRKKHKNLMGIDEYLDNEVNEERMQKDERMYLGRHILLYEYLNFENYFHLILQPNIPDIRISNRSIRPDLLFWVPSNDKIKIVVECDGFKYHSNKDAFIHDRKRDRALKVQGYDVLRYSGSEIYSNPIAASTDLTEYLWSIEIKDNV